MSLHGDILEQPLERGFADAGDVQQLARVGKAALRRAVVHNALRKRLSDARQQRQLGSIGGVQIDPFAVGQRRRARVALRADQGLLLRNGGLLRAHGLRPRRPKAKQQARGREQQRQQSAYNDPFHALFLASSVDINGFSAYNRRSKPPDSYLL